MKVNKLFTLDADLVERLADEKNQSKVVNELLQEYFAMGGNLEKKELITKYDETIKQINKLEISTERIKLKLENIAKREASVKKLYSNIPEVVLDDFRRFPNMDEKTLMSRYKNIWFKYKATFEEIKEAHREFFSK